LNAFSAIVNKPRANRLPPKETSPLRVSVRTISGLAQIFKQLADESRLKILLALSQDGELNVTALCELLGQSQPAVSHHLTLLRMTGLVGFRRDGKHNYYHIQSSLVGEVLEQFFADSGNGHKQINFDEFSLAYKRK
jgi:ArsR family transcriptional regulator, arsenate/arsenite/antimonite-responsive transcriptional repressor